MKRNLLLLMLIVFFCSCEKEKKKTEDLLTEKEWVFVLDFENIIKKTIKFNKDNTYIYTFESEGKKESTILGIDTIYIAGKPYIVIEEGKPYGIIRAEKNISFENVPYVVTGEWIRNGNEIIFATSRVKILGNVPPRQILRGYYTSDVSEGGTDFKIWTFGENFLNTEDKGYLNYDEESNSIIGEIEEQRVVKINKLTADSLWINFEKYCAK